MVDQFALVKRYRGRQQIVASGTLEFCETKLFSARFAARPVHTKSYPISFFVLPIRKARAVKF